MEVQFDQKNRLGEGGYGSVFPGTFNGRQVAVKRVYLIDATRDLEENILIQLKHPNVVQLFHVYNDDNDTFKHFVLELCAASLDQLFLEPNHPRKYKGPKLPHNFTIFLQLAEGLEFIHSKNFIHRDIKPANVLISVDSTGEITMKWADFGLSRFVNERGTYTMNSGIKGTKNWYAPELLKTASQFQQTEQLRGTVKSDVFALALVIAYLLLDGHHLYGSNDYEIYANIVDNKPVNMSKIDQSHYAWGLLNKMLEYEPGGRLSSSDTVQRLKSTQKMMETRLFELLGSTIVDLQEVKALIDEGVNVNCVNQEGLTPLLHLLLRCKRKIYLIETIQLLIDNKVEVNSKDNDQRNALHFVCLFYQQEDLIDIIRLLIQHGIVVKSEDKNGHNALHFLCEYYKKDNLIDIVHILIDNGIDINSHQYTWNVLHILCRHYQSEKLIDVVRLLIDKGINLNYRNNFEENALQTLCWRYRYNNWIEVIRLLVEKGIDVNNRGRGGWNALLSLCKAKYKEENLIKEIQLLIEKGIDINSANDYAWNVLHILCQNYKNENLIDIVRFLIANGIDVKRKTNGNWNALLILCKNYSNDNLIDIVRILIKNGIEVNHTAKEGNALHLLCKYYPNENLVEILQLLISNGIRVRWNGANATILISENPHQANNERAIQLLNQHI